MTVHTLIAPRIRGRRRWFAIAVAVVAAAAIGAALALAVDSGSSGAERGVTTPSSAAGQDGPKGQSIMSMTPALLAGVGLGTGYALPSAQNGPTSASVLASMSPQTRRHTEAIMALTFEQLAAGAAGSP